jgi:SAM-dependent methyltransferase
VDLALLPLLRCPRSGRPLTVAAGAVSPDGAVSFGVLEAEGFEYPVVAGIPLLTPGRAEVVDLVGDGRHREAVAVAALGDVARSRVLPVLDAVGDVRPLGRLVAPARRLARDRQRAADVRRLFGGAADDRLDAEVDADPLALLFLSGRRPTEEGYNYFRFRFGTPRYLVGLALLDALGAPDGPVLDVGCGAGHFAWALTQRTAHPVVGVDPSFAQLLTARRLAPRGHFVCGDGRALPLAGDAFHRVLSSDVLPYVAEKPAAVRELVRALAPDGTLVLTALRNSRARHVHAGEPLTPEGWAGLAGELRHRRLLGDDAVLDRYLDRLAPGALDAGTAARSQTVSVVAAHQPIPIDEGRWREWPHACGPLAVHPLLRPEATTADGVVHVRRFPSETYRTDNQRIEQYLPARCVLPTDVLQPGGRVTPVAPVEAEASSGAGAAGDGARLDALVASVAVMALPPPMPARPEPAPVR